MNVEQEPERSIYILRYTMIYKDAWLKYVQTLKTIDIFLGVHQTNLVYAVYNISTKSKIIKK